MNYIFHIIVMVNIYVILTLNSNLLVGMTNLLSLGQAAFYGIAAYLTVFSLTVLQLPLIPAILLVMLLTGVFSLLIAYPSLRLKGDYFVFATLGFQFIVFTILYNWVKVTRGPYGIAGIPAPKLMGFIPVSGIIPYLILSTVLSLSVIVLFKFLINSPYGRILKGVRDDEISMLSIGKNVTKTKIQVFFICYLYLLYRSDKF